MAGACGPGCTTWADERPIGSGKIKGGHRHIIPQRLKLAGSGWKEPDAQAMPALRAARATLLWHAYPDRPSPTLDCPPLLIARRRAVTTASRPLLASLDECRDARRRLSPPRLCADISVPC